MWIRHCYNKVHVFLVLKIGIIHKFCILLVFWRTFLKKFMQLLWLMQLIYIVLIDQIVNFSLCWFYALFVIRKHFVEVLGRWKNVFWVSHFTPDCGTNETVPLPQTNNSYNINWVGYLSQYHDLPSSTILCIMPNSFRSYIEF